MAESGRHGGWRRDTKAKTLDVSFDGERSIGFATFETVYGAPTVVQKAPLGHAVFDPQGGMWRYCKAGAAITNPILGAGGYAQPTDLTPGPGITAVGATTIACTGSGDASCTADQYADGTIIIGAAAANRRFYHIKSNTASATTTTTLTLHHPVRYAIAGTEWATINPCPWRDVRPMAGGMISACCMPLQPVTNAYYFWGKTRGPIFGVVSVTVPGAAANDRLVVFTTDGSMIMADESWNAGNSRQICGWLMPRTGGSYGGGDQGVWLQIE